MFHSCHCCTPNPSSDTNIGLHEQIVLGQLKLWYFALSPDLANRVRRGHAICGAWRGPLDQCCGLASAVEAQPPGSWCGSVGSAPRWPHHRSPRTGICEKEIGDGPRHRSAARAGRSARRTGGAGGSVCCQSKRTPGENNLQLYAAAQCFRASAHKPELLCVPMSTLAQKKQFPLKGAGEVCYVSNRQAPCCGRSRRRFCTTQR